MPMMLLLEFNLWKKKKTEEKGEKKEKKETRVARNSKEKSNTFLESHFEIYFESN